LTESPPYLTMEGNTGTVGLVILIRSRRHIRR